MNKRVIVFSILVSLSTGGFFLSRHLGWDMTQKLRSDADPLSASLQSSALRISDTSLNKRSGSATPFTLAVKKVDPTIPFEAPESWKRVLAEHREEPEVRNFQNFLKSLKYSDLFLTFFIVRDMNRVEYASEDYAQIRDQIRNQIAQMDNDFFREMPAMLRLFKDAPEMKDIRKQFAKFFVEISRENPSAELSLRGFAEEEAAVHKQSGTLLRRNVAQVIREYGDSVPVVDGQ